MTELSLDNAWVLIRTKTGRDYKVDFNEPIPQQDFLNIKTNIIIQLNSNSLTIEFNNWCFVKDVIECVMFNYPDITQLQFAQTIKN